ncbi:MAG: hypothetical protein HC840_22000, partial [Leptolyngbyaceae cyanobacterium RM2_2_4]|nr:hypothetical protein [Leptolyngbyaceae cyanobacterium RM2_2_4]
MSKVSSNHPRNLDRPTHDAGATVSARRRSLLTRKTYVRSLLMTGAMGLTLSVCGQFAAAQESVPVEAQQPTPTQPPPPEATATAAVATADK